MSKIPENENSESRESGKLPVAAKKMRFPKWSNIVTLAVLAFLGGGPVFFGMLLAYGANPVSLNVGYSPVQPVPYSHLLHVRKLGIDCRYCHNTVEKSGFAAIPPAQTCMNCHTNLYPTDKLLDPVRHSYQTGDPVPWIKIHDLPDYVYFNHGAHVNAGVSCVECHGQINHMDRVAQKEPLNMSWCLSCHRNVDEKLRPRNEVTNLDWVPTAENLQHDLPELTVDDATKYAADRAALGGYLKMKYNIHPSTDCVTCHR